MKKVIFVLGALLIIGAGVWYFTPLDYYEYAASSADECLAGELYDEEYQVCYFDYYCESDDECAEVDARYGQLLSALADEYAVADHEHVTYSNPTPAAESSVPPSAPEDTTLTTPAPEPDPAPAPAAPEATTKPAAEPKTAPAPAAVPPALSKPETIEDIMAALLPTEHLARIVSYKEDSDGPDGTLAYVEPATTDGSSWILAYDPVDSYTSDGKLLNPRELITTLVHEYMHIVSLNDTQVDHVAPDVEYIECREDELIINEGCLRSTALLYDFINRFWDESERQRAYEASLYGNEEDDAYERFEADTTAFVTEYAATNPIEDLAESFAMFVMRERNDSPSTLAEEKVAFFYQYPDMTALRIHMRGGMVRVLR